MANIKTLYGSDKLREAYPKVNENFNNINTDTNTLRQRVENIITTPAEGVTAQEIIDARKGEATLGAKIDAMDTEVATHVADDVTDANGAHGLKIESGAFTPTLEGTSVAGVHTYVANGQNGVYVKIGNLCHVSVTLAMTAKDPAMSGGVYIKNLPFTPKHYGGAAIGNYRGIAIGSNNVIAARVEPNAGFRIFENGDNVGALALDASKITDTTQFYVSATYRV